MSETESPDGLCLLAFDTATRGCSAALWRAGGIEASRAAAMERGQSEALLPMIEAVMNEAGAGYDDLDAIAVTIGPGAFTGLRIGLAAARGMALAAACPVIGVGTLEAVARGVPESERSDRRILVVLDAKRADHYAQTFAPDLSPLNEPRALPAAAIAALVKDTPVVLAGDGAALIESALDGAGVDYIVSTAPGIPDAAAVAALAAARWSAGARPESLPRPLYLRAPDVSGPAARTAARTAAAAKPS
ncbi:MAG: tRNA (adenosine(37)-N6)-threonylcarbamoyltransferase complex dimerization subunit type 1 TsaB [Rhodospirillales bacterium]